jgi:two-component system LytT family response regulator
MGERGIKGRLRAVVADDEPLARRRLRALLGKLDVRVIAECENGLETVRAIELFNPEVAFLDIRMPGLDGIALCDKLAESHPFVVFVTAFSEYAVRAFELRAVDYVLKPYSDERLKEAVARVRTAAAAGANGAPLGEVLDALRTLRSDRIEHLAIRTRRSIILVPVGDVDWIGAADNYVRLHIGKQAHLIRATMTDMESRLPLDRFLRVHREVIVNLTRVHELRPSAHGDFRIVLHDGSLLPLSRRYRRAFEERLSIAL